MREILKVESMIRTDTLNGWEIAAALQKHLMPYIVGELKAVPSTGHPSDGIYTSSLMYVDCDICFLGLRCSGHSEVTTRF